MANTGIKNANEIYRNELMANVATFLNESGEDVGKCATNKLNMPFVDANGDDQWVEITFTIKKGSKEDGAYEGYSMRDEYLFKVQEKAEKQAEMAKKKAEKIKKDAEKRKKIAEDKAKKGVKAE